MTKHKLQIIVLMLALLMGVASESWALGMDDIILDEPFSNGSVVVTNVDDNTRLVTLTVTPNSGYKVTKGNIIVQKLLDPGKAQASRRTPGITDVIPVDGPDVVTGPTSGTYNFTVPEGYDGALVSVTFTSTDPAVVININRNTRASQITDPAGHYKVTEDGVDASVFKNLYGATFTGELDGGLFAISGGLRHPLFSTVSTGAVIKNVILEDVQISQNGPVGAIAGTAEGYSRIYNCGILPSSNLYNANTESSFLQSSGGTNSYCGGIVGWLKDDSRVINCFSYANITGGTDVAGIVGHNEAVYSDENGSYGSTTEVSGGKYYRLRNAVVNCMFYGNITSGSNRWPVYGGAMMRNDIDNGINNYDFYRVEASLGLEDDSHYNCSWPAKEEYLTNYEYYRNLLNSNRELCGWWVKSDVAPNTLTTDKVQKIAKDASLIAKWVLDPSIAPYPILKTSGRYPSVINQAPQPGETSPQRIDPETKQWVSRATASTEWTNPKDAPKTEGQALGKITVTIKKNASDTGTGKSFTITAMDIKNNDFCYGKIQLPYYNSIFGDPTVEVNAADLEDRKTQWNSRYGGNYNDNVVVGWEISAVSGGVSGITNNEGKGHKYSTDAESGYNFADRYCTEKDANRVFAQGGYYYVPYGVTAITITAKWATAIYLDNSANHDYDKVNMSAANVGKRFLPAGTRPTTLANGQTVITDNINNRIPSGGSVYENAIVLVGNHQYRRGKADIKGGANTDGCTIMSADFDLDEEPDYCLIWQLGQGTDRQSICPIRFDFLPVVEIGMAMKQNASTNYYSLGCYLPLGHYEVTETALIHFGQFEFGNSTRTIDAPLILNGGIYDQYCKGTKAHEDADDHIDYIILGGNVYMPSFTPGAHVNSGAKYPTRHCPVNVIGGKINKLYLTGNYNNGITPNQDNPHCYIDGGDFDHVAAAGKEGIDGNVTFIIDHAKIKEFYGGSTLSDKLVTGDINVTIDNSYVEKYCGGPKFGNMNLDADTPANNKTVTTNATGTTFGVYYGGGNGGTSYVQYDSSDATVPDVTDGTYSWDATADSNGHKNGKLNNYTPGQYRNKATGYKGDYEMEIVNTSTGTDAKKAVFRTYMYSAQFSATNTGPITNNLTDCKVLTNFYGGGNLGGVKGNVSSTLKDTEVQGSAFGAGYSASVPEVTIYEKTKTPPTINVYTGIITPTPDPDPASQSTTYTWCYKNKTTNVVIPAGVEIPTDVKTGNPTFEYGGKKYFYTEESLENLGAVTGKVTLNIEGTTEVKGSVYGGGEESGVDGDTEVSVSGGTIGAEKKGGVEYGNVYGGGKGKVKDVTAGFVKGNTSVTISQAEGKTTRVYHNVYGGGAYGSVGDFNYDANNIPTSLKKENTGTTNVNITGGTFGWNGSENGMVFGSSRGDVAKPEGTPAVDPNDRMAWVYSTQVNIGTENATGPTIKGSIYGSGENGHTLQNTELNIFSGTIGIPTGEIITDDNGTPDDDTDDIEYSGANYPYRGNVYGGGCGTDTYKDGTEDKYNPLAGIVKGKTTINIKGGHVVRNVYGAGAMGSVGGGTTTDAGKTSINVTGGRIGYDGNSNNDGCIFGAARGENGISTATSNLANVRETEVNINAHPTDATKSPVIWGSVFGGGEAGTVKEGVAVNMTGGLIHKDIYGGGALADTQTSNWNTTGGTWADAQKSALHTTTVRATGGRVVEEIFGGGLGEDGKPAYVFGDVTVELNKDVADNSKGCAVGQIFGCNNVNGTPKGDVMVHIYATQNAEADKIANTPATGTEGEEGYKPADETQKVIGRYDVSAVYGGGNMAAYEPADPDNNKSEVIIDGCQLTSIKTVYGGGNAACTPSTNVTVNGTFEVEELFGGGNGLDDIVVNGVTKPNPGANVGYNNYSEYYQEGSVWKVRDKADADTKEERLASSYVYGTGKASVNIFGGTVHRVFGGSNTKGNVRQTAVTLLDENSGCDFCVDEAYGGGKSAEMDAEAKLLMACIPGLEAVYGGAEAADVRGNVTLNITNGTFDRVFGGNNLSGTISGSITVNVEEIGCKPVKIGELYGGGNEAGYSVYGYDSDGKPVESGTTPLYNDPQVNVMSFTSIGNIYGGGYGEGATMVGNPTVNINVAYGRWYDNTTGNTSSVVGENAKTPNNYPIPSHATGKIGAISNVFGGGNAAKVIGNTTVNVGTLSEVYVVKQVTVGDDVSSLYICNNNGTYSKASGTAQDGTTYYEEQDVIGADIRGNVYGGGNNAEVTGNTNVTIGKDATN